MQRLTATRLAVIQAKKLFGVAEQKLNLEACFVIAHDGLGLQREVGSAA